MELITGSLRAAVRNVLFRRVKVLSIVFAQQVALLQALLAQSGGSLAGNVGPRLGFCVTVPVCEGAFGE
eukprot:1262152-Lingulodinium_polyedra.AAC.1